MKKRKQTIGGKMAPPGEFNGDFLVVDVQKEILSVLKKCFIVDCSEEECKQYFRSSARMDEKVVTINVIEAEERGISRDDVKSQDEDTYSVASSVEDSIAESISPPSSLSPLEDDLAGDADSMEHPILPPDLPPLEQPSALEITVVFHEMHNDEESRVEIACPSDISVRELVEAVLKKRRDIGMKIDSAQLTNDPTSLGTKKTYSHDEKIIEIPYVNSCIYYGVGPIFYLLHSITSELAFTRTLGKMGHQISIQCKVPTQKEPISQILPGGTPVFMLKRKLWMLTLQQSRRKLGKSSPLNQYRIKVTDSGETITEESSILLSLPYVRKCKESQQKPCFTLEDMPSRAMRREEKLLELEIGSILGRPLCWSLAEDETSWFRRKYFAILNDESKRGEIKPLYAVNVEADATGPCPDELKDQNLPNNLITVYFNFSNTTSRTFLNHMKISPIDTPESLMARYIDDNIETFIENGTRNSQVIDPYQYSQKHIMRIFGKREYFQGDVPLYHFTPFRNLFLANLRSLQAPQPGDGANESNVNSLFENTAAASEAEEDGKKAKKDETIVVESVEAQVPKLAVEILSKDVLREADEKLATRYPMSAESPYATTKEELNLDLQQHLYTVDANSISLKYNDWSNMTCISIHDMEKNLRIKVVGVEGISTSSSNRLNELRESFAASKVSPVMTISLTVELYHGGVLIAEPRTTYPQILDLSDAPCSHRMSEYLTFELQMKKMPKHTRACFTLWLTYDASSTATDTPLADTPEKPNARYSIAVGSVQSPSPAFVAQMSSSGRLKSSSMQSYIFESTASTSSTMRRVALGSVSSILIDYENHFRSGMIEMALWPDTQANPIGTCQPYSGVGQSVNAAVLFFELDSYNLPVVFPEPVLFDDVDVDGSIFAKAAKSLPPPTSDRDVSELNALLARDPLYVMTAKEKSLVRTYRDFLIRFPGALSKAILATDWTDRAAKEKIYSLMPHWARLEPVDALGLLHSRFPDEKVRTYAVDNLSRLPDSQLRDYLLQLVQALQYEATHDSALARFLIRRALRNRAVIGHDFFWHLMSLLHSPEATERYSLILEFYLRGCGAHRKELYKQMELVRHLDRICVAIKAALPGERRKAMINAIKNEGIGIMKDVKKEKARVQLPISSTMVVTSYVVEKCRIMSSAKLPLFAVFKTPDYDVFGEEIAILYKHGDDLRQDQLTIQLLRIMDRLWLEEGLYLHMTPYLCVATGKDTGMIEIVKNAKTTAAIQQSAGLITGALRSEPIANYLREFNTNEEKYRNACRIFTKSCAGYCVATYVLGIGDRHNDNVMVAEDGHFFHIDFGHFLGHFKKIAFISRERSPFLLTPDIAYVMGGKDGELFAEFKTLCCRAYNILRRNANLFMSLFAMMLSTGIPELKSEDDIKYLREMFSLEMTDDEAANKFLKLIDDTLNKKVRVLDNAFHILAHSTSSKTK